MRSSKPEEAWLRLREESIGRIAAYLYGRNVVIPERWNALKRRAGMVFSSLSGRLGVAPRSAAGMIPLPPPAHSITE
jgi:hypothetical protein